jgi:hypothetical protein
MKKLNKLLIAGLLLNSVAAQAGTVTITGSGFANLPATAPSNWPASVTWPGGGSPNGTKTYTISDADWVFLLTWTASTSPQLQKPATPTAAQILLAWVQSWINGSITAVQQYHTTPPTVPPPITIQ